MAYYTYFDAAKRERYSSITRAERAKRTRQNKLAKQARAKNRR